MKITSSDKAHTVDAFGLPFIFNIMIGETFKLFEVFEGFFSYQSSGKSTLIKILWLPAFKKVGNCKSLFGFVWRSND